MEDKRVMEIPIDNIVPNPYQPRRVFSQAALEELSESIKVYGILQPITVRNKGNDEYELVAGERRLRASKLAGRATIPAIINKCFFIQFFFPLHILSVSCLLSS